MKVKQKRKPKTKEQRKREAAQKLKRYHEVLKHDPDHKAKSTKATRAWQANNPEKYMLSRTKSKCKKENIPFNLKLSDIKIPDYCPVLGVKLIKGRDSLGILFSKWNSASIDRINPKLGYTKENIQVISMRANLMKNDSSPEELLKFADWIYFMYKISSSDS